MENNKFLICYGNESYVTCKLGNTELPSLPPENILFDKTTINNVKRIRNQHKKKEYYIRIDADDYGNIVCNEDFDKYGLVIKCRVEGKNTSEFPSVWEIITDLPEIHEDTSKDGEKLKELFNEILENNFPYLKEKVPYLKPFVSNELSDQALLSSWLYDYNDEKPSKYDIIPIYIAFGIENVKGLANDKLKQDRIKMDIIHELTHVSRELEHRYKRDVGEEEGETYLESMIRGDMKIRIKYPLPHGEIEQIVYVKHCILPRQYCFKSLKEAREFEEFNYELVTGKEKPVPITPESPEWEEIEKRIPIAPIVDMIKGMKGSYNVLSDVSEYWVIVTSPTGNKYMYMLSDMNIDNEKTDIVQAIEDVDKITPLTRDDIEKVWDYP